MINIIIIVLSIYFLSNLAVNYQRQRDWAKERQQMLDKILALSKEVSNSSHFNFLKSFQDPEFIDKIAQNSQENIDRERLEEEDFITHE